MSAPAVKAKPLRDTMPLTAAWIDAMREAFGREYIDGIIRAGMNGSAVFHAAENGHTIGTPIAPPRSRA